MTSEATRQLVIGLSHLQKAARILKYNHNHYASMVENLARDLDIIVKRYRPDRVNPKDLEYHHSKDPRRPERHKSGPPTREEKASRQRE